MPDEKTLVPVFVPPLAQILAFAERQKGSPLTENEVKSTRDQSACIMMERAHAEEMAKSRGYVDVNPRNCSADWYRLRAQMTGKGYLPKIVLCIPGGDEGFRARCEPILEAAAVEHEFRSHEKNLTSAFKAGSITWQSFTAADFDRIDAHTVVLYVLSKNFVSAEAPGVSRDFLALGRRVLDAGGIAIKCESSGISHQKARWVQLDERANGTANEGFLPLFHAYVQHPIGSQTQLYTCGMHLIGAPDLIISEPALHTCAKGSESMACAAAGLFRIFALYFLEECPVGGFGSGDTFSIGGDSPRFRLIWEPCTGYAEDDFFFNPFGRWRFTNV